MDQGSLQKHVISTTLDLPPSCIEFSEDSPDYFVVGTYNLEKDAAVEEPQDDRDVVENDNSKKEAKTQERNGSLVLYRYENDELYVNLELQGSCGIFTSFPDTASLNADLGMSISNYWMLKRHLDS